MDDWILFLSLSDKLSDSFSLSDQRSVYNIIFKLIRTNFLKEINYRKIILFFLIFLSGSIDLPVNNDAVTRAELRRTRLDLIRREYEVNKLIHARKLHATFLSQQSFIMLMYINI